MIQAWMVYRGFEIERLDETSWRVMKNREQVYAAKTAAEARAWIDGKRDNDIAKTTRAYARKRR